MAAARFIVRGKVQGVGFRAATRRHAAGLGIHRGHAINRADGDVEVLAVGDHAALAALEDWLQRGPLLARVDGVRREAADDAQAGADFAIG